MVVVPIATVVARPVVAPMVAAAAFVDAQVACVVRSCVEPSV